MMIKRTFVILSVHGNMNA